MKRLLLLILFCIFYSYPSLASQSIHVKWEYTPPAAQSVTGYRLYQNGAPLIDWLGSTTAEGDAFVDVLTIGDYFTMTALFDDSTESPQSQPYIWDGSPVIHLRFATLRAGNVPVPTSKPGSVQLR